jgi:tetratricopeptide (TPR) repeat protein
MVYHLRLQNALQIADKQRLRAEGNARKMLDAAEGLLTEVGVVDLVDVPEMDEVRARLLEKALRFYEGLLHETEDPDPALRRQTAHVLTWTASLRYHLGRQDLAESGIQQAVALCRQLADDFPGVQTHRRDWAIALNVQGDILTSRSKQAEATAVRQQARALWKSLPLDQLADRRHLAYLCNHLGHTCPEEEQARLLFQEALDLLEGPAQGEQSPGTSLLLTAVYVNLGVLHANKARSSDAEAAFQKARSFGELAVREARWIGRAHGELASAYHNLASMTWHQKRPEEAEELYRKALELRQQLVRAHPNALPYLHDLLTSHETLARFCELTGRAALKESHLREAIAILKPRARPGQPHAFTPARLARIYLSLGHALWVQKKSEEALASIQQAITLLEDAKRQGPLEDAGPAVLQQAYLLRQLFWQEKLERWGQKVQSWSGDLGNWMSPKPQTQGKGK